MLALGRGRWTGVTIFAVFTFVCSGVGIDTETLLKFSFFVVLFSFFASCISFLFLSPYNPPKIPLVC